MFRPQYYNLAIRLTKNSKHPKHQMAAVLVRGGQILAQAHNLWTYKRHAEMRVLQYRNCEGATLYIARNNGGISKPCPMCMAFIQASGIKEIVYATFDGSLCRERIYS